MEHTEEQVETPWGSSGDKKVLPQQAERADSTHSFFWFIGILAIYLFAQAIINPTPAPAPT